MDREALRRIFPSLGSVRSIKDIRDRIADIARSKKPGEWIVTMPIGDPPFYVGVPDNLAEMRWPTRHELDAAAPHNPVYIRPIWGYWRGTFPLVSCANTAALTRAGITRDTVAPVPSVTIEKDGNGDPTGAMRRRSLRPTGCGRCRSRPRPITASAPPAFTRAMASPTSCCGPIALRITPAP
jgi:predicted amidohydrolase YtcJ